MLHDSALYKSIIDIDIDDKTRKTKISALSYNRRHWSNDDCVTDKRGDYQNCVLCCV